MKNTIAAHQTSLFSFKTLLVLAACLCVFAFPHSAFAVYYNNCGSGGGNPDFNFIDACGGGGGGGSSLSATLTATPSTIASGDSSLLAWSSSVATSCTGTNFSTGGATSGSVSISPSSNTTYTVACTDSVNTAAVDQAVTVTAPITSPDLNVSPTVSPNAALDGVAQTYITSVLNGGNGSAGPSTAALQKATDSSGSNAVNIATASVGLIPMSGTAAVSFTNVSLSAGTWYLRACADSTNAVAESNEGNNCGTWTTVTVSSISACPFVLLAGVPSQFSVFRPTAAASNPPYECTIRATWGDGTADSVQAGDCATNSSAAFSHTYASPGSYLLTGSTGTWQVAYSGSYGCGASAGPNSVAFICGYSGVNVGPNMTVISAAGFHSGGAVAGSAQANPACILTVTNPTLDLTAGSVSPNTATGGIAQTYTAQIVNIGSAAVNPTTAKLQKSTDSSGSNAVDIATASVDPISVASVVAPASFTNVSLSAGTWYLRACADSTNAISESNEGNNCGTWTSIVVGTAPINGACSTPATHYSCAAGTSASNVESTTGYTWSCTGANSGTTASCFETKSPACVFPSAPISASYKFLLPGTYYVRACANFDKNWGGSISELASPPGVGNCGTGQIITVSTPPPSPVDLRPTSDNRGVTVVTATPMAGQSTTLSASFKNYGTAATSGTFPDLFEVYPGTVVPTTFAQITGSGGVVSATSASLLQNAGNTVSTSYTFPYGGVWQVRACANTTTLNNNDTGVAESVYTNNCGDWTTVVVATPWARLYANGVTTPLTILKGSSVTLSWESGYATACTGSSSVASVFSAGVTNLGSPPFGSVTFNPLVSNTYSVFCTNGAAPAGTSNIGVTVINADLSLVASPTTVRKGGKTQLTWSASGSDITSCTIKDQKGTLIRSFNRATEPTGSQSVAVNTASTYTLSCLAGSAAPTATAVVKLTPEYIEF